MLIFKLTRETQAFAFNVMVIVLFNTGIIEIYSKVKKKLNIKNFNFSKKKIYFTIRQSFLGETFYK